MEIGFSIILFIIIYLAVRLAIRPLLKKPQKIITHNNDFGLDKLRDIGVFSDTELGEIIKIYNNKSVKKENHEHYQKYAEILNELKEMKYYTEEQYYSKIDNLKNYFKVN